MLTYEISNPHDEAYIDAPTDVIAVATVAVLGEGKYAAKREGFDGPFFFIGGHDEWFSKHTGVSCLDFLRAHSGDIAAALRTVRLARERTSLFDMVSTAKRLAEAFASKADEAR